MGKKIFHKNPNRIYSDSASLMITARKSIFNHVENIRFGDSHTELPEKVKSAIAKLKKSQRHAAFILDHHLSEDPELTYDGLESEDKAAVDFLIKLGNGHGFEVWLGKFSCSLSTVMDRNEQEDDYRIKEEYDMQALECISGTGKLNIANVSWDPVHFGERDSEDFKVDMEPHRIFEWCTRFDEHSDCCRGECPRDLDGSDESVSSVKSDSYDSENEDDDEPDWIVKEEGFECPCVLFCAVPPSSDKVKKHGIADSDDTPTKKQKATRSGK